MELETEDRVLHGHTPTPRPDGRDLDALAMAARSAWAAAFAPTVEVVVKKRRLFSPVEAEQDRAMAAPAEGADEAVGGERGPRVFVLPKDPALAPAAAAAAPVAADTPVVSPRRRRRTSVGHRPSPVVHIVMPAPAPSSAPVPRTDDGDDDADAPFALSLPVQDEYKAAQAALARLRGLVQEASQAQAFKLKLPRR